MKTPTRGFLVYGRIAEAGSGWAPDLDRLVERLHRDGPGGYWVRFVVVERDVLDRGEAPEVSDFHANPDSDFGSAVVRDRSVTLILNV